MSRQTKDLIGDEFPDGYRVKRPIPSEVVEALRDTPSDTLAEKFGGPTIRDLAANQRLLDYFDEDATSEVRERSIVEDFIRRNPMNPYQEHLNRHSDIREHLGLLRGLALQGDQVVELGFRSGVSASAFLSAGAKLYSVDIDEKCRPHVQRLAKIYPDTFTFKVADSRTCEIPECDLLFIDSDHTEATTLTELCRHHGKVKTWIVLHDTESFGRVDRKPGPGRGVMTAIETFLEHQPQVIDDRKCAYWDLHLHLKNNNGLTLLKRR